MHSYIPLDRRQAMAKGENLPHRTRGRNSPDGSSFLKI